MARELRQASDPLVGPFHSWFALARLTPFPSGSHVELSIRSHWSEIGCLRVWVKGEPCWAIGADLVLDQLETKGQDT